MKSNAASATDANRKREERRQHAADFDKMCADRAKAPRRPPPGRFEQMRISAGSLALNADIRSGAYSPTTKSIYGSDVLK